MREKEQLAAELSRLSTELQGKERLVLELQDSLSGSSEEIERSALEVSTSKRILQDGKWGETGRVEPLVKLHVLNGDPVLELAAYWKMMIKAEIVVNHPS